MMYTGLGLLGLYGFVFLAEVRDLVGGMIVNSRTEDCCKY